MSDQPWKVLKFFSGIMVLFLGFAFGLFFPYASLAEEEAQNSKNDDLPAPNIPWTLTSFQGTVKMPSYLKPYVKPHGNLICATNEDRILTCFEWLQMVSCLELHITLLLPRTFPYIFAEDKVPDIKIDNYLRSSLNKIIELEKRVGDNFKAFLRRNTKTSIAWRVQVGGIDETRAAEKGIYHRLLNGEELTFFIYTEGGPTIRTTQTLEGLAPILEASLNDVEANAPELKQCKTRTDLP